MSAQDVGRFVVQCACERTARWSGEEQAREAGWCRTWKPGAGDALVPIWTCPGYLSDVMYDGPIALAMEHFEIMRLGEPARFAGCVDLVERWLPDMKPGLRIRWRAWVKRHREQPKAARKTRAA